MRRCMLRRLVMDGGVQQADSVKDIDAKIGILLPPSVHNVNQVLFFPAAVVKRVHVGPVPCRDFALHDSVIFVFIERPQSSQLCADSEEKSELLEVTWQGQSNAVHQQDSRLYLPDNRYCWKTSTRRSFRQDLRRQTLLERDTLGIYKQLSMKKICV